MSRTLTAAIAGLAAVAALAFASAAFAKDGDVRVQGRCTGAATAKLKLSEEDGRIEVEFEVDQNRNGVRWQVVLKRNGTAFFSGSRVTRAPSGSFEVRRLTADGPGTDVVTARATSPGGQVCRATARF
jgi:uncharacterized membrane protein YgdD (TMEM256/DUF423 family)